MTDRELMRQALEALEWAADHIPQQKEPVCDCPVCVADVALRERLAQPQRTHWEGCEEVHPECRKQKWVGLEQSDMPDGEDPIYDDPRFIAGMVWAANKLKEKNAWT